jgi:hypothetical protein
MEEISLLFTKIFERVFDQFLHSYGFALTESQVEKTFFSVIYRNGERYVRFGGTLIPQDFPFYYYLSFGEGSDKFPDSDWNAIALWRFIKSASPTEFDKHKDLFELSTDITENQIEEKIHTNLELSISYATLFLANNLTEFRQVRAMQNKDREPTKVIAANGKGGRSVSYEKTSVLLKDKYSK